MCSCHYPRMLCHVFWSQVEYKIVCFIIIRVQCTVCDWNILASVNMCDKVLTKLYIKRAVINHEWEGG